MKLNSEGIASLQERSYLILSDEKITSKAWLAFKCMGHDVVREATSGLYICDVLSNANDAQLIATSPELYYALQSATEILIDIYSQLEPNTEMDKYLWDKIRQYTKTLSRARGEDECTKQFVQLGREKEKKGESPL